MGNFAGKQIHICDDRHEDIEQNSVSVSLTTLNKNQSVLDPRSPTADISRTPIESITSVCNLDSVNNQLPLSELEKKFITHIDSELALELQNSNFINNCDSINKSNSGYTFNSTEDSSIYTCDETQNMIQKIESNSKQINNCPKLLDSSPISKCEYQKTEMKIVSAGLLETNLDYVETDLDKVTKLKMSNVKDSVNSRQSNIIDPKHILRAKIVNTIDNKCRNITPSKENLTYFDPRSPTSEITRTPVQIIKTLDIDPRSPTLEFVRTPIQVVHEVSKTDWLQKLPESANDCIKDSQITLLKEIENEDLHMELVNKDEQRKSNLSPRLLNDESALFLKSKRTKSTPDIHDLVCVEQTKSTIKSRQNLIYEDNIDKQIVGTPKQKLLNSVANARTPLSDCNPNKSQCRSKSASGRLKENSTKEKCNNKVNVGSDYTVSKIPMYRDSKKVRNKLKYDIQQSENIPPKEANEIKKRKPQWDNTNNTLII